MLSKSEPLPEGTVIMADNQFAGRGQQENVWHATAGLNLTFSIFLKPTFLPIEKQFMLNMAVSMGVIKAIRRFVNDSITVKWPNDIYYLNRKIGGILIENSLSGRIYKSSIIGIGINVNQTQFAESIKEKAVSIVEILQEDVNLLTLLKEICGDIEAEYLKLKSGAYRNLLERYLNQLYLFNQNALFKEKDLVFEGKITDVRESGQLVINRNGINRDYNFKEIEFLR